MPTNYNSLRCICIIFISLFFNGTNFAQNSCPNSDFSQGSFSSWEGYTGTYSNPGQLLGVVGGQHTIITTAGIDPFTCGGLSTLPPGGTSCARLGNSNTGAQGERLRYQITVTADNALFVYKYAVVLEDAGHSPAEQPEFTVRILDQSDIQIGGSCGIYTVYGGQPGQNFQSCGSVTWLPWTVVGVDLTPFIGQNVQVEFSTKDCNQGGHFGYAYVAAECLPLLIDVAYCEGSNSVTLTAPPGFQSYLWSPGGQTTQSITEMNPTLGAMYNCSVTSFSNQGSCTVSLAAQVFPTDVFAGFTLSPACQNVPVQFTDTSFANNNGEVISWNWDFGDGGISQVQNPTHTYTTSGTFDVQLVAYSDDGCTDTMVQTLNIFPVPVVDFVFQDECVNSLVSFTNQSTDALAMTYEWDFGDASSISTLEDPTHTYTTAGQYDVNLITENSNGCIDSLLQVITIFDLPAIDAGPDVQTCPGFQITLAASGGTSYSWDNGITDNTPFTPIATATYTVTGTDANGCVNTDNLVLTFFSQPIVNAGPDQAVCNGTAVTYTASGTPTNSWDNGILDGQSFTRPVGTYTFTVTGTDNNGCIDSDVAQLIVNPNPIVGAGTDQLICLGTTTFVSGSGANTYAWDNAVVNTVNFSPTNTTTYSVIGTDVNGCTGTDQVVVAIEPPTSVQFSAPITSGCEPLFINFTNQSTGSAGVNCTWDYGDGQTGVNCGSISHTYLNPGCYDVTLTVTTALGCVWNNTLEDYICVFPNPIASFTPTPNVIDELDPLSVMNNSSTGAVEYSWSFGDGATSSEEEPEHTFPYDPIQNYLVELIAITENGCKDTTTQLIIMNPVLLYYVPNTFTPDNDEFNQTFQPVFTSGFDPFDFSMFIFNRWGEVIFETNNDKIGWDGTYHGQVVQEGTYTWKIEFKLSVNDERKVAHGNVNILR